MASECDNLDAYLLGDLAGDANVRFERHLGECADCREAVDQERWLDSLLQSPVLADLEPVPEGIVQSIQVSIDRRRKRRRMVIGAMATAASLAVAAGWTVWAWRQPQMNPAGQVAQPSGGESAKPSADRIGKAVVVGDENMIIVPVESRYPNVTVVRVYPEYRPKHVAQADTLQPADVDEFDLPKPINGG